MDPYLTEIRFLSNHYSTEGTNIKKVFTHELDQFQSFFLFRIFCILNLNCCICLLILIVKNRSRTDIYIISICALFHQINIIANLPLKTDISYDSISCLGINSWHISHIGISVRVSVFDIEQ